MRTETRLSMHRRCAVVVFVERCGSSVKRAAEKGTFNGYPNCPLVAAYIIGVDIPSTALVARSCPLPEFGACHPHEAGGFQTGLDSPPADATRVVCRTGDAL